MKNISLYDALYLVGKRKANFNRHVVSCCFDKKSLRCIGVPPTVSVLVKCTRFWSAEGRLLRFWSVERVLLFFVVVFVALSSSCHY